jgi:hypothetical protein
VCVCGWLFQADGTKDWKERQNEEDFWKATQLGIGIDHCEELLFLVILYKMEKKTKTKWKKKKFRRLRVCFVPAVREGQTSHAVPSSEL